MDGIMIIKLGGKVTVSRYGNIEVKITSFYSSIMVYKVVNFMPKKGYKNDCFIEVEKNINL